MAARFLHRHGARIVARNLRIGAGELDLVIEIGGRRVAVEVKAARERDPVDAFSEAKARQVWSLARQVRPTIHRVDLVAVTFQTDGVRVRWVPDAA